MDKTCPSCEAAVSIFAQFCPECGHEFSGGGADEDEPEIIFGTLAERFTKEQRSQLKELRAARRLAFEQDENPSTPIQTFIDQHGFTPPSDWTKGAALGRTNASLKRRTDYLEYLERHWHRSDGVEDWVRYHCRLEFGMDTDRLMSIPFWWQTLKLPPDAGPPEIRAAYREATLTASTQSDFHRLNTAIASAKHDIQGAG